MIDEQPAREPNGEDARLDALAKRLEAVKQQEAERTAPSAAGAEADANYRMGNRVLAELIGGIGGGAFIGWVIDRFAGTTPWGLLVVMALGIVVAFRNIIRISSRPPE